jgi:hypothetical protein
LLKIAPTNPKTIPKRGPTTFTHDWFISVILRKSRRRYCWCQALAPSSVALPVTPPVFRPIQNLKPKITPLPPFCREEFGGVPPRTG